MWALSSKFDSGEWSFFSPCTDASGAFTSSVYSSNSIPCNQSTTTNSPIGYRGTSATVSPSYQLSYSSLPFMAAAKLGGLTLKKQFQQAFELPELLWIISLSAHSTSTSRSRSLIPTIRPATTWFPWASNLTRSTCGCGWTCTAMRYLATLSPRGKMAAKCGLCFNRA